jgi:hypothetical protein
MTIKESLAGVKRKSYMANDLDLCGMAFLCAVVVSDKAATSRFYQ